MAAVRSPEIESLIRRTMIAYAGNMATLRNLMTTDPALRILGFDEGEWWTGAEFFEVRATQSREAPDFDYSIKEVEAFEDDGFGWAAFWGTLTTGDNASHIRHTAVLRLEAGAWKILQLHNSSPVSNQAVFGVDLTTTLDDLVTSVLESDSSLVAEGIKEGTATLVFTDIVDSTPLAEALGDEKWSRLIRSHETLIGEVAERNDGSVVKFLGDGSMLAFESARAALRAAVEIQRQTESMPFSIRIGIHTGEVRRTVDDLLGVTVNKAARIASGAGPGGISISSTTRDLVGSMDGVTIGETNTVALKGMAGTHQVVAVGWT